MYDVARHKDISFKIGIVSGSRDKEEECEKNFSEKMTKKVGYQELFQIWRKFPTYWYAG